MTCLIIVEHDNRTLKAATRNAVTAATQIGGEIHLLVAGSACAAVAEAAARIAGVAKVLVADGAVTAHLMAEPMAALLVSRMRSAYVSVRVSPGSPIQW